MKPSGAYNTFENLSVSNLNSMATYRTAKLADPNVTGDQGPTGLAGTWSFKKSCSTTAVRSCSATNFNFSQNPVLTVESAKTYKLILKFSSIRNPLLCFIKQVLESRFNVSPSFRLNYSNPSLRSLWITSLATSLGFFELLASSFSISSLMSALTAAAWASAELFCIFSFCLNS